MDVLSLSKPREVLFLIVRATIANCDDYEDIVDWGQPRLSARVR